MLAPIRWLNKYVDINVSDKELADRLTMTGTHVDSIIDLNKNIKNVVVGKIIKIEQHPNADKLVVTKVDIGNEEDVQIVTGATNIKEGDLIPVALHGAKLPGGVKIKNSKLRGIESQGMMCSYEELGFEDKVIPKEFKDGILIMNDVKIGSDINDALNTNGQVLDIEITYNRPDCLSVVGIARETAATLNTTFKYPEIKINDEYDDIKDYFNGVRIEAKNLCERFYARVVKDVEIKSSPQWLQRELMDAGMRPVNNIVDITNYVMLEFGQPLHAYDLEKLEGKEIIVRRPKKGEKLTTLDKSERKLDEDMLIIADAKKAVGIAGVMGGYDSEVTNNTKTIIIECASFNSKSIRETSKKIGLRSEASARNEKGLNLMYVEDSCERVCQLIEMLGIGKVIKNKLDVGMTDYNKKEVSLRPYRVEKLLGVKIEVEEMLRILNKLEIESVYEKELIISRIPYFRSDITQEVDLIEEVGRIYGLETIASKSLEGTLKKGTKSDKRNTEDSIKQNLVGLGFIETTTYSFISSKAYKNICASEKSELTNYIKILNPLGEDYSIMRTTLIPNMLDTIRRNYNRKVKDAKLFEVGNVFIPKQLPIEELPIEKSTLCIGMYGKGDFYTLKGIIEQLLERNGIECVFEAIKDNDTFHPGRTAGVYYENDLIAILGEINPEVADNYDIKDRVYIAEIDIDKIVKYKNMERKYAPLPKYPSVLRDIAIIVKEDIPVGKLKKLIKSTNIKLIEEVKLFDIYKGEHIDEGYKSVAFSIIYRDGKGTLTDKRVNEVHDKILKILEVEYDAKLR